MSKPARPGLADGRPRAVGRMQPRQAPQFLVAERLDAEAHPVDARRPERREPRLGHASRDWPRASPRRQPSRRRPRGRPSIDPRDLGRFEQRRRAAAEDRSCRRPLAGPANRPALRGPRAISRTQRVDIARLCGRVEQPAVEVAVVADGRTERDVEVEAQRHRQSSRQSGVGSLQSGAIDDANSRRGRPTT